MNCIRPAPLLPAGMRRAAMLLACGMLLLSSSGCQIIIGLLLMLQGPPTIEADFKDHTKKNMAEKGKKVIVLCTAPEKAKGDYASLEVDLITEVTRRMRGEGIQVVDEHKTATWLDDRGGQVDEDAIADLCRKFKGDYVILFEIDKFSTQEENSPWLHRGRTECKVLVLVPGKKTKEIKRPPMKTIYTKEFSSVYPVHQPVSAEQRSIIAFRKEYISRVSDELARLFYDHRPGEDF